MDLRSLGRHPQFPSLIWAVVEQPGDEPYRLDFNPETGSFRRTSYRSLFYDRGWPGAYGWVGGLGTPPDPHCDVILITRQHLRPGEVVEAYTCGIFYRSDHDNKLVALDSALRDTVTRPDLSALDPVTSSALLALYPRIGKREGWWGAGEAQLYLRRWRASAPARYGRSSPPLWGPGR